MVIEVLLLGGLAAYIFYPKESKRAIHLTEDEIRDYLNYRKGVGDRGNIYGTQVLDEKGGGVEC